MNLQTLGLQELSTNEQVETNGGGVLIAIAIATAGVAAGLLTAYILND